MASVTSNAAEEPREATGHNDDPEDLVKVFESKLNLEDEEGTKLQEKLEIFTLLRGIVKKNVLNHENFFNWIPNEERFENLISTIYAVTESKFIELDHEKDESEVKYNCVELLAKRLMMAFLATKLKKPEKVKELLEKAEVTLDHYFKDKKYISIEYIEGYRYILQSLKQYWATVCNDKEDGLIEFETVQNWAKELLDFDKLTVKNQVAVYSVKQLFHGEVDRSEFVNRIELLEKMIKMDPTNYEWHLILHETSRFKRRQGANRNDPPGEKEISAVLYAAELAPGHPRVRVRKCNCLAEMIGPMIKSFSRQDFYLQFETQHFYSPQKAVEFVKNEAREILELDDKSVQINITIAEIFSSVLPYRFRDTELTKLCIERALQYHPNSSKANNRMGVYLLTVENNPDKAEEFFLSAFETDKRNFPAAVLLLQTYMANPYKNKNAIKEFLELTLSSTDFFTDERMAHLLVQKGYFSFMTKDFNNALESWVEAFKKNEDSVKEAFEKLEYFKKRYGWDCTLEYKKIEDRLKQLYPNLSEEDSVIRLELVKLLRNAQFREDERRSFRGRGRGGFSRDNWSGGHNRQGYSGGANQGGSNGQSWR